MQNENLYTRVLMDNLGEGVYYVDAERKILAWNSGAEAISGYSEAEMIGVRCWEGSLHHVDETGQSLCRDYCALTKAMELAVPQTAEAYLLHKKGHRVPVSIKTVPVCDDRGLIVGAIEVFSNRSSVRALRSRMAELECLSLVDSLTGLANRRCLEAQIHAKLEKVARYEWGIGVLFIDLDRFKDVNDTHGHNVGDEVLKLVARTLLHNSRAFDVPGRWGGEEYLVLTEHVDADSLKTMAERYRLLVASSSLPLESGAIQVTVSIGASLAKADDDIKGIIDRVDRLMYRSKREGRNRVSMG